MSSSRDYRGQRGRSIAWRLALALGTVLLTIGLVTVSCLWAIFDIHGRLHSLKHDEERARSVIRLASAVRDQYAHVAHTIILGNDSHVSFFREATERLTRLVSEVGGQAGPKGAVQVERITAAEREIGFLFESQVLPAIRTGDHATLAARHERILALAMTAQDQAEILAGNAERSMEDLNRHVSATQHGVIVITIVAHLLALGIAVLVGVYLYRTIAHPVALLSAAASRVGAGDLETEIAVEREDELGRLSRRFNEMMRSMKEHQKRLLQAERLVGLASISAGIAHELNNPIGVILGYAKLLQRRGGGIDTKVGAADSEVLAAIEEEAERCHQVIEGLLELSRGGTLNTGAVDLRSLAEDAISRLRIKYPAPRVTTEVHGHAFAQADKAKVGQILSNLIGNAFEACNDQGRIVVLLDTAARGIVTVEIHDTGSGIAKSVRDEVFEPFFTTKPSGSGLGLAVSRAIARAHGGDVVIISTTERGSTFRLTLQQPQSLEGA